MKTVLIIHGIMGHAGIHWQGWLKKELEEKGYKVLMPEMPNPNHPDRKEWLKTIKELTKNIKSSDLIIIGHSLGVATALDYLEIADSKINGLVSVSGFYEDYGVELNGYYMAEKDIDFEKVNKNLENKFVIYGDNDPYVPQKNLENLAIALKMKSLLMGSGGHLNSESGYNEFPRLLNIVLSFNKEFDIQKAGGVLIKDKKLLVEKSPHREFWVAPGGKLEGKETPQESLERELWEEFRIKAKEKDMEYFGTFYAVAAGDKSKRIVRMDVYIVRKWKGEPKPSAEIEKVDWISSKIPKGMKVGSIFEHEVIPRLKESELIN